MASKFWKWYEKRYKLVVYVTTILFLLQIVHLYWLLADVAAFKLLDKSFFKVSNFWQTVIVLVDYTEIPAIITTSIYYIHQYKLGFKKKAILYLLLINSQWLHLFWITDEIVLEQFTNIAPIVLPLWFSIMAIAIDFLEVPVMVDTVKKSISLLRKKDI